MGVVFTNRRRLEGDLSAAEPSREPGEGRRRRRSDPEQLGVHSERRPVSSALGTDSFAVNFFRFDPGEFQRGDNTGDEETLHGLELTDVSRFRMTYTQRDHSFVM